HHAPRAKSRGYRSCSCSCPCCSIENDDRSTTGASACGQDSLRAKKEADGRSSEHKPTQCGGGGEGGDHRAFRSRRRWTRGSGLDTGSEPCTADQGLGGFCGAEEKGRPIEPLRHAHRS